MGAWYDNNNNNNNNKNNRSSCSSEDQIGRLMWVVISTNRQKCTYEGNGILRLLGFGTYVVCPKIENRATESQSADPTTYKLKFMDLST